MEMDLECHGRHRRRLYLRVGSEWVRKALKQQVRLWQMLEGCMRVVEAGQVGLGIPGRGSGMSHTKACRAEMLS